MKTKINLKESLSDDVLDLSLNDLQEVPVKEIATIPKATTLDLSCNSISSLSPTFSTSLSYLVKLDLSRNQLTELPENFGALVSLKHLDLFKNNLKTVPLSFGCLKSLRWLDLKENPLLPKLKQVIGDCDDNSLCQAAALNLVQFMNSLRTKVENEKIRREQQLKEEKEMLEKKENKQKNKNVSSKKNKNNKVNQANGKTSEEVIASQNVMQKKATNVKSSKKRSPSLFWKMLVALFKLILYSALFSLLSIFIISLIDEPTFHNVKVKVNYITKTGSSYLPKTVVNAFNEGVIIASHFVKAAVSHLANILQILMNKMFELYKYLSTDETVLAYVESLKHYCLAGYTKVSEVVSTVAVETKSFAKKMFD